MPGSAAVILKDGIVRLANAGLDHHIVVPIHDELLFDIPADEVDDVVPELENLMTDTSMSVPLSVSSSAPMDRWGK